MNIFNIKKIVIFIFLISNCFADDTNKLTMEMVLASSMKYYPQILESLENVEAAKMKIKEAVGEFDLKLKAKGDARPRGYYDGKSVDFVIEKPLPYMNSRIYTGYRNTNGEYPLYEGKYETLQNGEVRAGIAISLWQNRDLDSRRLQIKLNKLNLSNKELKVLSSQIKVKQSATKAYWKWVAKGNVYNVYSSLLEIALDRQNGLKKRVEKGDLAKIYLIENQKYIVKRRSQVIKSLRDFRESALDLSIFLRNENGIPLLASDKMLPNKMDGEEKITKEDMIKAQKLAMERSPELFELNNKIQELRLQEEMGRNSLMPRVDLNFEVSRDEGAGSKSLVGTENRAMLQIEIPIERNKGRGKMAKARFKRRATEFKRQLVQERMKIDINKFLINLNASVDKIENTNQEIEFANILQKAEAQKFRSGASDFFVVNIREENTADAKISNIKAHLEYRISFANYQAATLAFLD